MADAVNAARYGGEGVEEHVTYPYHKGGVLLAKCLAGGYVLHFSEPVSNPVAYRKLAQAADGRYYADKQEGPPGQFRTDYRTGCDDYGKAQAYKPYLESLAVVPHKEPLGFWHCVTDDPGCCRRQYKGGEYLAQQGQERVEETLVRIGVNQRENQRYEYGNQQVDEYDVGHHPGDADGL